MPWVNHGHVDAASMIQMDYPPSVSLNSHHETQHPGCGLLAGFGVSFDST